MSAVPQHVSESESEDERFDNVSVESDVENDRPENPTDWVAKGKMSRRRGPRHMKVNKNAGVVYISRLPDAFAEPQMKQYFRQFGKVQKIKLVRSKKSGKPKGWGWMEFETPEIAEIVAKTMNGYRMFGRTLKSRVIPTEQVHDHIWRHCNGKWKPVGQFRVKQEIAKLGDANKDQTVSREKRFKARAATEKRRNEKLAAMGIDYSFSCWSEKAQGLKEQCQTALAERLVEKTKDSAAAVEKAAEDTRAEIARVEAEREPKLAAAAKRKADALEAQNAAKAAAKKKNKKAPKTAAAPERKDVKLVKGDKKVKTVKAVKKVKKTKA